MVDVGLVPYGMLADGSYGVLLGDDDEPLVSVCEVLATLPDVNDEANFVGRLVFGIDVRNIFVWTDDPEPEWIGLQAQQVEIGEPEPSASPPPAPGSLYYSLNTEVLYLWDNTRWIGIGGQTGSSVIWRHYTGDGATSLFDTGATTIPPVEYVQVFVDGLELSPGTSSMRDYYMIGNKVQLNFIPDPGSKIAIRTLTFLRMARNSRFITSRYVADGVTNQFSSGVLQADPSQLFVYIDGVMQQPDVGAGPGTFDYRTVTQDLTVESLTASGTTITMVSREPHHYAVGDTITIRNALEPEYNGEFLVASVVNPTTLTYTVPVAPSASPATPNPEIIFGPALFNDYVVFVNAAGEDTPPPSGAVIQIRAVENVIVGTVEGEINRGDNIGAGAQFYAGKEGVVLQFKTLTQGPRVRVTETPTEVMISAVDDSVMTATYFNGSPATYIVSETDRYIGVRNATTNPVAIDVATNIPTNPAYSGRILTIKDEAGNAGTYNISIVPAPSSSIEGLPEGEAYVIDTDRGSVTMAFDGQDWHLI